MILLVYQVRAVLVIIAIMLANRMMVYDPLSHLNLIGNGVFNFFCVDRSGQALF